MLKDTDGVIDIDMPVSGNLDDPKFRYGALIWKAFVNLLTKIVTSPFRALAALFGGGEEVFNAVNFEPGAGKVPPPEQEKLATLLKALTKRPQLKLVVTGRYHSDSDGQAIKQLQVRRALAKASGTVLKPGENPGPVDFSNPDSQQTLVALFVDRYGKEAYEKLRVEMAPSDKSGTSEKPHKDPGKLAKLLFSDLIKREPVDPTMLKQLADERAQAIVQQMTGPEGIPHERIVVKPSEGTNSGDSISSILGLDAMTSKPEG